MEEETLASKIKKARKEKILTQEELAIKAGVTYTTLSKIESGQVTNPTINTLKKIADALKVSVDDIISIIKKKGDA